MLEVTVPSGLSDGDLFHVQFGEQVYEVAVPPGVCGGQTISLDLAGQTAEADSSAAGLIAGFMRIHVGTRV